MSEINPKFTGNGTENPEISPPIVDPNNPEANFTPSFHDYTNIRPFRYWVQSVLPLVYDDSLSYQELLGKVVNYLNDVINNVNATEYNVEQLRNAYIQLQNYVNEYYNSLDVQEEINNKLDAMAADGSLTNLIDPLVSDKLPPLVTGQIDGVVADQIDSVVADQIDGVVGNQIDGSVSKQIGGAVNSWMDENVQTPITSPLVDKSLTMAGQAADAEITGRELAVKANAPIKLLSSIAPVSVETGKRLKKDGTITTTTNYNLYKFNVASNTLIFVNTRTSTNEDFPALVFSQGTTNINVVASGNPSSTYTFLTPINADVMYINAYTQAQTPFVYTAQQEDVISQTNLNDRLIATIKAPNSGVKLTPIETKAGYLWNTGSSNPDGALITNNSYTAKKYTIEPGNLYFVKGAQPANANSLITCYDENNNIIYTTGKIIEPSSAISFYFMAPPHSSYMWINTYNTFSDYADAYEGKPITNGNTLFNSLNALKAYIPYNNTGIINHTSITENSVMTTTGEIIDNNYYNLIEWPVTAGTTIHISAASINSELYPVILWAQTNSNSRTIRSYQMQNVNELEIVPEHCNTLFLIYNKSAPTPYIASINTLSSINKNDLNLLRDTTLTAPLTDELEPDEVQSGFLWNTGSNNPNGALIANSSYTAKKYTITPGYIYLVKGAQPANMNSLVTCYTENDIIIYNTGKLLASQLKCQYYFNAPTNAAYMWINTYNSNPEYSHVYTGKPITDIDQLISPLQKIKATIPFIAASEAINTEITPGYVISIDGTIAASNYYSISQFTVSSGNLIHINTTPLSSETFPTLLWANKTSTNISVISYQIAPIDDVYIVPNDANTLYVNYLKTTFNPSVTVVNKGNYADIQQIKGLYNTTIHAPNNGAVITPDETQPGYLWSITSALPNGGLVEYSGYTAKKYTITPNTLYYITGQQPASQNNLITCYDADNHMILRSSTFLENGYNLDCYFMSPPTASYMWINTRNSTPQYADVYTAVPITDINKLIDKTELITASINPAYVQYTLNNFKIRIGANGANDLFNLINAYYGDTFLFGTSTDWLGPYRFQSLDNPDGDFTNMTTGGNHVATTEDGQIIKTAKTLSHKILCDGVPYTYGTIKCNQLEIFWVNQVMAGNTVKIDGTGQYCLEEHYHLTIGLDGVIHVHQWFKPLVNIKMTWYSGLQFAGNNFATQVLIPQYKNGYMSADTMEEYVNDKVVDRINIIGDTCSIEMFQDRTYGAGRNTTAKYVTGAGTKVYMNLWSYADPVETLNANDIFEWRGSYKFYPTN